MCFADGFADTFKWFYHKWFIFNTTCFNAIVTILINQLLILAGDNKSCVFEIGKESFISFESHKQLRIKFSKTLNYCYCLFPKDYSSFTTNEF